MRTKIANILNCDEKYLIQQVNCIGVMGKGLAKQIADKWPAVKSNYMVATNKYNNVELNRILLGHYQTITVRNENVTKHVINIFGQFDYARNSYDDRVFTDYNALIRAFTAINARFVGESMAIPYNFGCGLANGDWNRVKDIIDTFMPDIDVVLYRRPVQCQMSF